MTFHACLTGPIQDRVRGTRKQPMRNIDHASLEIFAVLLDVFQCACAPCKYVAHVRRCNKRHVQHENK